MEQILLRPQEAATALGVSRSKVYELLQRGEIPKVIIGCSIRVPAAALQAWIDVKIKEQNGPEAALEVA